MTIALLKGDCLDLLPTLEANSIDACVTDPPYGLSFMGKNWDRGVPGVAFWQAILRVLKPGAHLVAFGGTRTSHRIVCAIDDAGFEIRDTLMWIYGTGFPKSHNLEGGLGTALKPAFEPIVLARKPLSEGTVAANVLRLGTGALNIGACRVPAADVDINEPTRGVALGRMNDDGWDNTKLRGTQYKAQQGRWPANVVHDGSDEVVRAFPNTTSGARNGVRKADDERNAFGTFNGGDSGRTFASDSGSAARFFYSAKASKADRANSKHPTVKPISLIAWLARLITPPGGTVLDPFAGSGTTGVACERGSFNCILIEREPEYQADIERRLSQPSQPRLALA